MKQTDSSPLFPTPFGAQADSGTLTQIPATKTAIGRASLALGFPKETFTPIAAGGVPPYGDDMNGILNMLSQAVRAAEAGLVRPFSASYAQQIGGYPKGALVCDPNDPSRLFLSVQDNNTNPPEDNDPSWQAINNTDLVHQADIAKYALQSTLNAETQRAQAVEEQLVSGNGFTDKDLGVAHAYIGDSGTVPAFLDQNRTPWRLATRDALASESQRAQNAEKQCLPLSGGTLTGTITTSRGVIPEVLGASGRVVIQQFIATGTGDSGPQFVSFPQKFADGTRPVVTATINREPVTGYARSVCFNNTSHNNDTTPDVNNVGVVFWPWYAIPGTVNATGTYWTIHVIAIGVL